jgi:hypothetical protein
MDSVRILNNLDRRHFVGGSDARVVMGQDEKALVRLWQEKRGEVDPEDLSGDLIVQSEVPLEPCRPSGTCGAAGLSGFPSFPEPNAGAPAVFVDELDAGRFQGPLRLCAHFVGHRRPEACFKTLDSYEGELRPVSKVGLRPS